MPDLYDQYRRGACDGCRDGIPIDIKRKRNSEDGRDSMGRYGKSPIIEPDQHIAGYTDYTTFNVPNKWTPCAALPRDQWGELKAQECVRLRKAIEAAPCSMNCRSRLPMPFSDKARAIFDGSCNCWKHKALEGKQ